MSPEIRAAGLACPDPAEIVGVPQSSLPGTPLGPGDTANELDPLTAFAALPGFWTRAPSGRLRGPPGGAAR